MNLNQLSNEATKQVENNIIRIENLIFNSISAKENMETIQRIYGQYVTRAEHDLSSLFPYEPNVTFSYEGMVYGYGFEWNKQRFILYVSERGLAIEVQTTFRKDQLELFLQEFVTYLQDTIQTKKTF